MLLTINPFLQSFFSSDLLGKTIFLTLFALSVVSWVIIIHKIRLVFMIQKHSFNFEKIFDRFSRTPLSINHGNCAETSNPFYSLYRVLKKQTLEVLAKNRAFSNQEGVTLSHADMQLVESQLVSAIASENKIHESSLYLLATVYTLAPFLGLLGTVWGILTTFSELQASYGSASQQVLNGLSLALATTVLGLIAAIPALIGYNYLKNAFREYQTEMERFATRLISAVELHYRQIDSSN